MNTAWQKLWRQIVVLLALLIVIFPISASATTSKLKQNIGAITFTPATLTVGGSATVSAKATSGLPISFSSNSASVCKVSGSTVTSIAAGTCTVLANQAGNASYSAATQVSNNLAVSKVSQSIGVITFIPASLTVGGNATVSAAASSRLPVSFSSNSASVCTVSGSKVTSIAAGNCTVLANQAGNATYNAATQVSNNLAVSKVSQSIGAITFTPASLTVGGNATVSATASSGLPVSFSSNTTSICTVSGNTVTSIAAGTCTVLANQAGNGTYSAAPQISNNITVSLASQSIGAITFTPTSLSVGRNATVSATATSGLPVSFSSNTTSVCTVSGNTVTSIAAGTCTVLANQAGNASFIAAAQVGQDILVASIPITPVTPVAPIDSTGLESYWALDNNWHDAMGRHDLTPINSGGVSAAPNVRAGNNFAYGPTGTEVGNGAFSSSFTSLPEDNGITLEGWVWLPDDSSGGLLFGFGGQDYEQPKLNVFAAWGFIYVDVGSKNDSATVGYSRIGDTCWHHLAFVLPKGFRSGMPFRFYLDGKEDTITYIDSRGTGAASVTATAPLFGSAFGVGAFAGNGGSYSGGSSKIDEVRAWSRELTAAEISTLATPTGHGAMCENAPVPHWAPGPRFVPPATMPIPAVKLGVHVLTDDTISIITDPNPWLKSRIATDSGPYLQAMEANRQYLPPWFPNEMYDFATKEVITYYRPQILLSLADTLHFSVTGEGLAVDGSVTPVSLWPQATREFRTPNLGTGAPEIHTTSSENVYYSYIKLPASMTPGATYQVTDSWGNSYSWVYDESKTISWALKVDQVGYLADAAEKFAYLGGWLGPNGGALDLSRFEGKNFNLVRESDNQIVFSGPITFRGDESGPIQGARLSGEKVYQLDFSSFTTPDIYYIQVPGIGRSWGFTIGQNAMGEAFFTHARGMFHQRCAPLDAKYTPWARGDAHHPILKAFHATELHAYEDNSAAGWGLLDENGKFPAGNIGAFEMIQATKTTQVVSDTSGEWHDAGDFSRDGMGHVRVVEYFSEAYLAFPDNFKDNQLNIPESRNGIPDILDEAAWGMDLWRRLQEPDGRAALYVEAESHPQIADPGLDTQLYYQGMATRNSSLEYAEHAARLAHALALAGATQQSASFLDSAKRAYAFAMSDYITVPRISVTFPWNGHTITWIEPPALDPGQKVKALVQLWLASGDAVYYSALNTPEMTSAFAGEVQSLYWRNSSFDFLDVALAQEGTFPAGWRDTARNGVVSNASDWLGWQQAHAYRKLWYAPGQGYFWLMGWGGQDFFPIMHLVAAWKISGEERFRTGALNALNFMHGANPQGRVNTTGLGQNYVVHPLHLPSDSDGIADPVPGISIYGYFWGIPYDARTTVYGLFNSAVPAYDFNGSALAQLPQPWSDTTLGISAISDILYASIPVWRNITTLEAANVPQMEFDITSTIGPAATITGCLMGSGWMPSQPLLNKQPKTETELEDALWYQP